MSIPDAPRPVGPQPSDQRGGCLAPLAGLLGIVLLLPGICSLLFMIEDFSGGGRSARTWGELWVITFFVAAGGIALIRYALRSSARPGDRNERS